MNLSPPPESKNISTEQKEWNEAVYKFLQYMALHQMKFVGRSAAPTDATAGVCYYDSDDNKLKCHNGTGWQDLF